MKIFLKVHILGMFGGRSMVSTAVLYIVVCEILLLCLLFIVYMVGSTTCVGMFGFICVGFLFFFVGGKR